MMKLTKIEKKGSNFSAIYIAKDDKRAFKVYKCWCERAKLWRVEMAQNNKKYVNYFITFVQAREFVYSNPNWTEY